MVLLSTATASNSASITFTGLSSAYSSYEIVAVDVLPATDSVSLFLRVSTDGGSTYKAGASDYDWTFVYTDTNEGATRNSDSADSEITLTDEATGHEAGNQTGEAYNGRFTIYN